MYDGEPCKERFVEVDMGNGVADVLLQGEGEVVGREKKSCQDEQYSEDKEEPSEGDNSNDSEAMSLQSRCRPEKLKKVLYRMSEEQKQYVKDLGFGAFLKMDCGRLAKDLCYFILQSFDHQSCIMTMG